MLTDKKVKALVVEEKAYKVSDAGGLYLHVLTTGKKIWRFKYRYEGKEKLLTIGIYGFKENEISLKLARELRDQARSTLRKGGDPAKLKQLSKAQYTTPMELTFEAIALEWLEKKKPVLADITYKRHKELLQNDVIPFIGSRAINELETFELVICLERIAERGALSTAHKARQQLFQIFLYALQTGRIKYNPAASLGGAIQPLKKTHMAAITDPSEFGKLLIKIDGYEGSLLVRTALKLAPLVFQRPGELCAMEWSEIDLDKAEWVIPRSKKKERNQNEGDHIVPLSSQSVALLRDIEPVTGMRKFVFPNQRGNSKCIRTESLTKALRTLGVCTKTEHSVHGFRASACPVQTSIG